MARNAPGSFALFGGSAMTKEYLFKLSDYSQATWGQSESVLHSHAVKPVCLMCRLCRFYRWCCRFHHCRRSPRCRQDAYPERQLQLDRRRWSDHQGDDQAGGCGCILQGPHAEGSSIPFLSCSRAGTNRGRSWSSVPSLSFRTRSLNRSSPSLANTVSEQLVLYCAIQRAHADHLSLKRRERLDDDSSSIDFFIPVHPRSPYPDTTPERIIVHILVYIGFEALAQPFSLLSDYHCSAPPYALDR